MWARQNLFGSWLNTLLTALSVGLVYLVARGSLPWLLSEAKWAVIGRNFGVIGWGRYPNDQAWRLGIGLALLLILGVFSWWAWRLPGQSPARRFVSVGWLVSPVILFLLLRGLTLPTPVTISNNLGYYLFRPEVLPLLEEDWRAIASLLIVGLLAGITWGLSPRRANRILAIVACLAILGLCLPLGLQAQQLGDQGLRVPRLVIMIPILGLGLLFGRSAGGSLVTLRAARCALLVAWPGTAAIVMVILTSFDVGVERVAPAEVLLKVEPPLWGGILLTLVLSTVSILFSFPIGVLLALGRRSRLPVVKAVSVLFIEIVRGVPLITILFMAQVMLPLFLPLEWTFDRVIRAMAGMTFFTAAYLAEIVRGGLQIVPHEQVEAARSLGLSELFVTGLVVLPQALRAVIPAIMGQFVSVFKDTSLVAIVGLLDLLGILQSIIKQREFLGTVREVYLFAGLFYFIISYGMSHASRRLEASLGVSDRF